MVVEHMWFPCVAKVVGHTWLHMVTDCTCMSTTLATGVNHPGCMCGTHGQSCVAHGGHELIMIQEDHGHHCVHVQPMSSGRWPCAPKAGAKLKVRLMMCASHGPQMLFSSAINPHEPHCLLAHCSCEQPSVCKLVSVFSQQIMLPKEGCTPKEGLWIFADATQGWWIFTDAIAVLAFNLA